MRVLLSFCIAVIFAFCNTANADVASGATVLNTPPANAGRFDTTVDQSELTLGYVSGVTDYDAYAASLPPVIRKSNFLFGFVILGWVDR